MFKKFVIAYKVNSIRKKLISIFKIKIKILNFDVTFELKIVE